MLENGVETWGNASIYYIAVRYDSEAETPTKLDEPKIIPFTVKHEPDSYTHLRAHDTDRVISYSDYCKKR